MASGFTSGTISGTSGSIRQAEELSITIGPAAPIFGDHSRREVPPALISTRSTRRKSNCSMSSHLTTPAFQPTSTPMDLREAMAWSLSTGKSSFLEDVQHLAAHVARGADDGDPVTHRDLSHFGEAPV